MSIVDNPKNLARGFADLHTPSIYEKELFVTFQERKEDLKSQIASLRKELEGCTNERRRAILKSHISNKTLALTANGKKANKRVDLHLLIIDRLQQAVPPEVFKECCDAANRDKKRILSKLTEWDNE